MIHSPKLHVADIVPVPPEVAGTVADAPWSTLLRLNVQVPSVKLAELQLSGTGAGPLGVVGVVGVAVGGASHEMPVTFQLPLLHTADKLPLTLLLDTTVCDWLCALAPQLKKHASYAPEPPEQPSGSGAGPGMGVGGVRGCAVGGVS